MPSIISIKGAVMLAVLGSGTVLLSQQPYDPYGSNSQTGQNGYGQYGGGYPNDPGFRRGFDDGMRSGQADMQRGKRVDPAKSENYEDAPGYDSSYGNKGQWKQQYRQGYTSGYQRAINGGVNAQYGQRPYGQGRGYGQDGDRLGGYGQPQYADGPGFRRGFDDGMRIGQADMQNGRRSDPARSESYEDTPGYDSSYGDKGQWKQQYRQGYTSGYQSAVNGGSNGQYGQRRYGQGGYGQDGYGQPQYADDPGYRHGFDDGMRSGQADMQRGKLGDPTKSENYEDAPGYNSAYGNKGQWKQQYRQGYTFGYQRAIDGGGNGRYGQGGYGQPQ